MTARLEIVQGIENDLESLEPSYIKLGVLDVVMVCLNLDIRVELKSRFLRYLYPYCKYSSRLD